jgi:trypsin
MRLRRGLAALPAVSLLLASAPSAEAIVGGRDAKAGELPFVAHVLIDKRFQCTGTLVDPTHVVTAAHCSSLVPAGVVNVPIGQPGQLIDVTLGTIETPKSPYLQVAGERRTGTKVDVHPRYQGLLTVAGDVAVITLDRPSEQPPVKVAGTGEEGLWKPGTMATIAGFGVTKSGGQQPSVLQVAEVPVYRDEDVAKLGGTYADFENETQLGAGFPQGGVDSCQGDSGGPLLVQTQRKEWRLAGDTSYGDGCAGKDAPGVYGRLGAPVMREWIRSISPAAVAPDAAPQGGRDAGQPAERGRATSALRTGRLR